MENLDRIKGKIKALLSRTVERGATEAEAKVALEKATKLMTEYQISQYALKTYSDDSIKDIEIELNRQSVYMRSLIAELSNCFECESYFITNTKKVHIYGYKSDVETVSYMQEVIFNALENELKKYKKSEDFECLIYHFSPRRVINSFISGFCYRMQMKIRELTKNKTIEIEKATGTALISLKKDAVKKTFNAAFPDLKTGNYNPRPPLKSAFISGIESAAKTPINKGVKDNTTESKILIGME